MECLLRHTNLLVLAEQLYEDLELWYPVLRLREEGAGVTVVGPHKDTYYGKHGYPVSADIHIDHLQSHNIDALIIPGGYAPDHFRRNPAILKLVREMSESGKIVAAICHAPWVLISAGVARGKTMTCFYSIKDDVINAGAKYRDEEVVRDGNLITSRQPSDLGAFCREIIHALSHQET